MPKAWIFVYRLPEGTPNNERVKFSHGLHGATSTSHGGRYVFERQGVLSGRPHLRPTTGVVVVGPADHDAVKRFLVRHGALVMAREIKPYPEDLAALDLR